MRFKPGLMLLLMIIIVTFIIQILKLTNKSILEEPRLLFSLILIALGVLTLVTPLVLIQFEIKELDRFRIDKYSFLSLGLCYFVNLNYYRQNIIVFLAIGFSFIYLIKVYREKKGDISNVDLLWSAKAFVISIIFISVVAIIQMTLGRVIEVPLLEGNIFVAMLRQIFTELSFVPIEEMFYRGFLWGYLVSMGWDEKIAIWVQGGIFWATHVERLTTPLSFFCVNTNLDTYIK